jgi:large subunit ribosomal protein L9
LRSFQACNFDLAVETVKFVQPCVEIDDEHHQEQNSCHKCYPSPIDWNAVHELILPFVAKVGKTESLWYNSPPSVVPFALILYLDNVIIEKLFSNIVALSNQARKGLKKMKVMLIKDVYKLGRAGDVKKVADGYGRNYLLPQGLAVLATPGALKQVERIRSQAEIRRTEQNAELKGLADQIEGVVLTFAAKAGETGKLYGSITTQNIADALQQKTRYEVKRHQIDMQPIRNLGEYTAHVRLTMDLVPEIKVIVYREGEAVEGLAEPVVEETSVAEAATEEEQPTGGSEKPAEETVSEVEEK